MRPTRAPRQRHPERVHTRVIVSILLLACGVSAAISVASEANGDRAETREALRGIVTELNNLNAWLTEADAQRSRWLAQLQEQDKLVGDLSAQADVAAAELAAAEARLAELTARHNTLEGQRSLQAHKISQHLSAAQRLSGGDFFKLLLNQQTPETFDRMLRYHGYFSSARARTLERYQATLDQLDTNRAELDDQAERHREKNAALADRHKTLMASRQERQALLAELDAQREDTAVQRERLLADRARLEKLLSELDRRTATLDGSQFLAGKGSLPWPLRGPIRATFGRPRADGRLVWHGMVVSAEEGTPVAAVFRGRVVFADWLRGFGLLIILDHGSGFMTLYGHAESLTKVPGDWVEAGELIARAGRSGGQSNSGLYFEIRQKGAAKDPLGWLAKRGT